MIAFFWSQGFLSATSSSTGSQQAAQNQAAQSGILIESATFTTGATGSNSANTPQVTVIVRNVGAVAVTLGSATMTGTSSNAGFKGSLSQGALSTSGSLTSTDGSWTYTLSSVSVSKGGYAGLTLTQGTANANMPNTQVLSGDVVNTKVTTTVGTFAQSQFNVP